MNWSIGKYQILTGGKLERLCPYCCAVLDDSLEPTDIKEIETLRMTIGKKTTEHPFKATVGKIRCPCCEKLIDVFIQGGEQK